MARGLTYACAYRLFGDAYVNNNELTPCIMGISLWVSGSIPYMSSVSRVYPSWWVKVRLGRGRERRSLTDFFAVVWVGLKGEREKEGGVRTYLGSLGLLKYMLGLWYMPRLVAVEVRIVGKGG